MKARFFTALSFSLSLTAAVRTTAAPPSVAPDPVAAGSRYRVVDGMYVWRAEDRFFNRPMYLNNIPGAILGGDRPALRFLREPYNLGMMLFAYSRGNSAVWLHDFAEVTARYRSNRIMWEVSDSRFPGLSIALEAVPHADGPGFVARMTGGMIRTGISYLHPRNSG